jgi:hypothetical protein
VADELGVRLVADGIELPREALMWASRGVDDEDSVEAPARFDGEATENREDALGFLLRERPDVRSVNFLDQRTKRG